MENKTEQSTEKLAEFLLANGKDPEKLIPKEFQTSEPQPAEADSSTEDKSGVDAPEKESSEIESDAIDGEDSEEVKPSEEELAEKKRLFDAKDKDLSELELEKKKELQAMEIAEKEAKKQKKIDKRFGELTGQLKDLKSERDQDKGKIAQLESELKQLKNSEDPNKIQQEVKRKEGERIAKYVEADKELPREERREMSRDELEQWMVEDMVGANEWLAERQLRRKSERESDAPKTNRAAEERAESIVRGHEEARKRVELKHPELNIAKRFAELKGQGKTQEEINTIIFKENPKVKIATEIYKENPDKYMLAENGPELVAEEMERRLAKTKSKASDADDEDRDARIAREAAESERNRQASIDAGIKSNRGGSSSVSSKDILKDPIHKQQVKVFMDVFKESETQAIARLQKRLKDRGELRV